VLTELVRAVGAKPDARSAEGIGKLVAQLHTMRRMSVSVAGMLQAGKEPVVEASIVKDIGTIWEQQLPHRVRELAAFVDADASNHATLEDQLSFAIKTAPKLTIQGGTTEVLRGIIARPRAALILTCRVMAGPVQAIHVLGAEKTWMPGTSPCMTG
jgi:hypothetical protein